MDLRKYLPKEAQDDMEDAAVIRERARKKRILKKRFKALRKRAGFFLGAVFLLLLCFLIVHRLVIPRQNETPKGEAENAVAEKTPPVTAKRDYLICVDPGHGGEDPGCVTEDRIEANDNLTLARLVRSALEQRGCRVVMTRDDDETLALTDRTDTANLQEAEVLLSLHRNYAENKSAEGVEVWINSAAPEDAVSLANTLLDGIETLHKMPIRSVKTGTRDGYGNYVINSHSRMTSCILEMGYMSNRSDNLSFDQDMESYAESIAESVITFLNSREPERVDVLLPSETMLAGVPLP